VGAAGGLSVDSSKPANNETAGTSTVTMTSKTGSSTVLMSTVTD